MAMTIMYLVHMAEKTVGPKSILIGHFIGIGISI